MERAAGAVVLAGFFSWMRELTTSTMSVRFSRSSMKLCGIRPASGVLENDGAGAERQHSNYRRADQAARGVSGGEARLQALADLCHVDATLDLRSQQVHRLARVLRTLGAAVDDAALDQGVDPMVVQGLGMKSEHEDLGGPTSARSWRPASLNWRWASRRCLIIRSRISRARASSTSMRSSTSTRLMSARPGATWSAAAVPRARATLTASRRRDLISPRGGSRRPGRGRAEARSLTRGASSGSVQALATALFALYFLRVALHCGSGPCACARQWLRRTRGCELQPVHLLFRRSA